MSIYSRSPSPPRTYDVEDRARDEDRRSLQSGDEEDDENRRSISPPNSGDEEDEKERKKKEAKKKAASKPKGPVRRMVISEDMLSGMKGITKLNESFKDFQFGGKGKEKEDLDTILSKIEQWIHTLHPKHPFDQSLERIEFLGMKKKSVKTLLKKMRMGMLPTMSSETVGPEQMFEDDDDDDIFGNMEEPTFSRRNEPAHFDDIVAAAAQPVPQSETAPLPDDVPSMEEQMEMEELMGV